jgi:hypothetical protein
MDKPRVFISHSFSDERLFFNRDDFNPLRFRGLRNTIGPLAIIHKET